MRKNFSENCPKFGQTPKMFASIGLGQKGLKNVGLKGRDTIRQPEAPNYQSARSAKLSASPKRETISQPGA
jgi:hypothetical protein